MGIMQTRGNRSGTLDVEILRTAILLSAHQGRHLAVGGDPFLHGSPEHNATVRLGNPVYLKPFYSSYAAGGVSGGANAVLLNPLWVPRALTVDEALFRCHVASAGQNFRVGINADNGGTPTDGAVLFDSGNISASPARNITVPIPPLALTRGIVWVALATSDNVMQFIRDVTQTFVAATALFPMFEGCAYIMGAWGPLTNPCPAVAQYQIRPVIFLHVASIDE